jgi:hypothetical protein
MQLEGSCHCGAVSFSVSAYAPVPFMRCYCSICRKTAGGGGYAINLGAKADTLRISGRRAHQRVSPEYRRRGELGGTALLRALRLGAVGVGPGLAGARPPLRQRHRHALPEPPEAVHMMLGSKSNWVRIEARPGSRSANRYYPHSLEDWHRAHGLLDDE